MDYAKGWNDKTQTRILSWVTPYVEVPDLAIITEAAKREFPGVSLERLRISTRAAKTPGGNALQLTTLGCERVA